MENKAYVYIMTNHHHGVLYTGMTTNLIERVGQHREGGVTGFTSKYNCVKLVYFKQYSTVHEAINEEKRIKGGSRLRKHKLIESINLYWVDLWPLVYEGR